MMVYKIKNNLVLKHVNTIFKVIIAFSICYWVTSNSFHDTTKSIKFTDSKTKLDFSSKDTMRLVDLVI